MKKRISTLFYLLLAIVLQLSLVFPQTDWSQVVLPNGRSIQVKMDHRRAAPQRLTGLDINFGQYGVVNRANLPALGRRFLGDHAALLQINTESLAIKNVKSRKGR